VSPNDWTAVGTYGTSPPGTDLSRAERWNGHSWSVQRLPAPAGAGYYSLSTLSREGTVSIRSFDLARDVVM